MDKLAFVAACFRVFSTKQPVRLRVTRSILPEMVRFVSTLGLALTFSLIGLEFGSAEAGDWPQFRGPTGDGRAEATHLPTAWGGFETVAWQTEIPGRGWSSPVVVGDRIWLTTAEHTALPSQRREKRLADSPYRDYRDQLQVHASVNCYAVEIAAATGDLLRTIELFTCDDPPPIHATNGHASPAPVADGRRLGLHFRW